MTDSAGEQGGALVPKVVRCLLLLSMAPWATAQAEEGATQYLDRVGWEVGSRYWYSSGRNSYNYYGDPTTSLLVSRLSYDNLAANSGELYFRGDLASRFFLKGLIGAGSIDGGNLIDEDFPPITSPYSRTSSDTSGSLAYGSIDLGYTFLRQPSFRIGGFAGYGLWHQSVDASGCYQTATNVDICMPSVPTSIKLVNETDNWNLLRLGAVADFMLTDRLKFTADVAYVQVWQRAMDDHIFTFGFDPASGDGHGFQLDGVVSYKLTDTWNLGVGGRWWHINTRAVDSFDQLLTYKTDRYGAFVQAAYRWN